MIICHREHFQSRNQPLDLTTKLALYYQDNRRSTIRANDITKQLRFAAAACQPTTGIDPLEISSWSLLSGGAMTLLVGKVDLDTIKLLGRWHSNAMMPYLHQDSIRVMQQLARTMYNNGEYDFLPDATVPSRMSRAVDSNVLLVDGNTSTTSSHPTAFPP